MALLLCTPVALSQIKNRHSLPFVKTTACHLLCNGLVGGQPTSDGFALKCGIQELLKWAGTQSTFLYVRAGGWGLFECSFFFRDQVSYWWVLYLQNSYKLKEKYLRSKAMIEKYNEELGAVDEENITAEDVSKFSLNEVCFRGCCKTRKRNRARAFRHSDMTSTRDYDQETNRHILLVALWRDTPALSLIWGRLNVKLPEAGAGCSGRLWWNAAERCYAQQHTTRCCSKN